MTGAGSGIGRATATRIASEGGRVIATEVVRERLAALAGELTGRPVITLIGDVAAVDTINANIEAAGDTIDGLANVAGIMDAFLTPSEVVDATGDRVFSVNVTGPMRPTRAVLPIMIEAGAGAIVNVASEASLRASARTVSRRVPSLRTSRHR